MADLQVGRELDAAVARALGCNPVKDETGWRRHWRCTCKPLNPTHCHRSEHPDDPGDLLAYVSSSDADALAALDAVMARRDDIHSINLDIRRDCTVCYIMGYDTKYLAQERGCTRPEAICRAILSLEEAT